MVGVECATLGCRVHRGPALGRGRTAIVYQSFPHLIEVVLLFVSVAIQLHTNKCPIHNLIFFFSFWLLVSLKFFAAQHDSCLLFGLFSIRFSHSVRSTDIRRRTCSRADNIDGSIRSGSQQCVASNARAHRVGTLCRSWRAIILYTFVLFAVVFWFCAQSH